MPVPGRSFLKHHVRTGPDLYGELPAPQVNGTFQLRFCQSGSAQVIRGAEGEQVC